MKSLSGWEAAHSDEHQFRAKIKVSTIAVFELSSFDKWPEQRKKMKNGTFAIAHLRLAVFHVAFAHLYESERHSKRKPGCLKKLFACLW